MPVSSAAPEQASLRRLDVPPAVLGEGPVWDMRHAALVWVDLHGCAVRRYHPETGREDICPTPSRAGAITPRSRGGYVVNLEDGFWTLDDAFRILSPALSLPPAREPMWMNDARCDPAGRLWAGVVSGAITPDGGGLYRLDANWTLTRVVDSVTLSNGLGWSPDARTMYHVDSRKGVVWTLAFDVASGTAVDPRVFASIPESVGSPDGLSVDREGGVWLAIWDAHVLRRYRADGAVDREVRLSPRRVSSCAFGGADHRDLYITTARAEIPEDEAKATLAGCMFVTRSQIPGLPIAAFAG